MYRVRPWRKGDEQERKRYKRILKVRLEERFLRSDDYFFDERLTPAHLQKGVWICLAHFGGVDEGHFLHAQKLPDDAFFKKETDKKRMVQIRVSALPKLAKSGVYLKAEPRCRRVEEDRDDEVTIVAEIGTAATQAADLEILYVSPEIDENFKLRRRMFARQNWSSESLVETVSGGALDFFWKGELCLPSFVNRFSQVINSNSRTVFSLSSDVFEASLRLDGFDTVVRHLSDLVYWDSLEKVLLPYYYAGRWSLVVYDLRLPLVENYFLSGEYDWKVRMKLEQILFSLQDKLMLRRVGLLAKNTYSNFSELHDSQFKSGLKVLNFMRSVTQGLDPKIDYQATEAFDEYHALASNLLHDVCFGKLVEAKTLVQNSKGGYEFVNPAYFPATFFEQFCRRRQ
jgi:hypothetical protein